MSRNLNYFEHFLAFAFAVSGCILISAFASIADIPIGIASSAVGLIFFSITLRQQSGRKEKT